MKSASGRKLAFTLESFAYSPPEPAGGNAVIQLGALSPEELEALKQELEANLQHLMDTFCNAL